MLLSIYLLTLLTLILPLISAAPLPGSESSYDASASEPQRDHYATLGVPRDASPEQIRKAWKTKAATAHPDKGGTTEGMQAINDAHDTLKDPDKRTLHDNDLFWSDFNARQAARKQNPPPSSSSSGSPPGSSSGGPKRPADTGAGPSAKPAGDNPEKTPFTKEWFAGMKAKYPGMDRKEGGAGQTPPNTAPPPKQEPQARRQDAPHQAAGGASPGPSTARPQQKTQQPGSSRPQGRGTSVPKSPGTDERPQEAQSPLKQPPMSTQQRTEMRDNYQARMQNLFNKNKPAGTETPPKTTQDTKAQSPPTHSQPKTSSSSPGVASDTHRVPDYGQAPPSSPFAPDQAPAAKKGGLTQEQRDQVRRRYNDKHADKANRPSSDSSSSGGAPSAHGFASKPSGPMPPKSVFEDYRGQKQTAQASRTRAGDDKFTFQGPKAGQKPATSPFAHPDVQSMPSPTKLMRPGEINEMRNRYNRPNPGRKNQPAAQVPADQAPAAQATRQRSPQRTSSGSSTGSHPSQYQFHGPDKKPAASPSGHPDVQNAKQRGAPIGRAQSPPKQSRFASPFARGAKIPAANTGAKPSEWTFSRFNPFSRGRSPERSKPTTSGGGTTGAAQGRAAGKKPGFSNLANFSNRSPSPSPQKQRPGSSNPAKGATPPKQSKLANLNPFRSPSPPPRQPSDPNAPPPSPWEKKPSAFEKAGNAAKGFGLKLAKAAEKVKTKPK